MACHGFGTVIPDPCLECSGEGRVRTPPDDHHEDPGRASTPARGSSSPAKGEVGPAGGPPGDLYVEIVERPHPVFTRRGDDLHCTLEVPMTAAALGTTVDLETLDGVEQVDVRPGTQSGEVQTPARLRRHPPARHRPR